MSSIDATLTDLIKAKVHDNMVAIGGYGGPLAQKNPMYFIQFCHAIAKGISDGSKVINFTTKDTGQGGIPPVPGVGVGVGIKVDKLWFDEHLYTEMRKEAIAMFGSTSHDTYPPAKGNTGEYLHAISKGVADSIAEHFLTAYNLTSAHVLVYSGVGLITEGAYSGLVPSDIEGLIKAAGPLLKGRFWPTLVRAVSKVYVEAIHMHSTGKVAITGVCIPMTPPAGPLQVCGIPMVGVGAGTAI